MSKIQVERLKDAWKIYTAYMYQFCIIVKDTAEVKVYNVIMFLAQIGRWHSILQPSVNHLPDYLAHYISTFLSFVNIAV